MTLPLPIGRLTDQALLPYFTIEDPSLKKTYNSLVFDITCAWNSYMYPQPHTMLGKKKGVGRILLQYSDAFNEAEKLKEAYAKDGFNLKMVVSVVSDEELAKPKIISTEHWKNLGVKHLIIPIKDYTAGIDNSVILAALAQVKEVLDGEENAVYTHCKAGRSRSVMFWLIYFALYGDEEMPAFEDIDIEKFKQDPDSINSYLKKLDDYIAKVHAYFKTLRPQVGLLPEQIEKAKSIIAQAKLEIAIQKLKTENSNLELVSDLKKKLQGLNNKTDKSASPVINRENHETLTKKILAYLGSNEFRNAIILFDSFREMRRLAYANMHYTSHSVISKSIKDFLDEIFVAKDGSWLKQFQNSEGSLARFFHTEVPQVANQINLFNIWKNPKLTQSEMQENKSLRESVCFEFISELKAHIAHHFDCDMQYVDTLVQEMAPKEAVTFSPAYS